MNRKVCLRKLVSIKNQLKARLIITNQSKARLANRVVFIASVLWLIVFSFLLSFFIFPPPSGLVKIIAHFGLAVSVFSAFYGAFSFSVNESRSSPPWLSSLSFSFLCASALLSLASMARTLTPLQDAALVHLGLSLYILWDLTASAYYKKHSRRAYDCFQELLAVDLLLFLVFFLIYVPSSNGLWQLISGPSPDAERGQVSVAIKAMILWGELLIVLLYLPRHSKKVEPILSVSDGYRIWSANYCDTSNYVISIERRHTLKRIENLRYMSKLEGTLLDFGCGTGRYTSLLATESNNVICIDQSEQMLALCKESNGKKPNITYKTGTHATLHGIPDCSLNGVLCCLVLDHMTNDDLRDFFCIAYDKLAFNGWLYITDVNSEYLKLRQLYAEFVDMKGFSRRIITYPHSKSEVLSCLELAGFQRPSILEEFVSNDDLANWPKLHEMVGFPLIVEYYVEK